MHGKNLLLALLLIISCSPAFSAVYYVAVNGSDSNTGSITQPFATIQMAQTVVSPGDTVYIRGGTYVMAEAQIAQYSSIFAYVTYLNKSGSAGKRINYWAYPGEKPVFDFSNVKPANYRVYAFEVVGSYIYIKGLEITGVQVTILTHTQSECFDNQGSNNIYEQLSMHDGQAIGFYLTKGSNNLVLNCDAYRNWDYTSEDGKGGNTDGFGCHPAKGGTGNIIKGCRAWFNSDDGYDCINSYESVTFDSCWSFYNGYSTSFASLGDGNGFKGGGYGQAPVVSGLPNPIPSHTVRFCMAYRNKANGFYANHHVVTGSSWYNNTAYRNATNYNMLSQRITTSAKTGADTTLDCPGFNHVLHNNVSFKYSSLRDTLNIGSTCDITYNTFTPLTTITVSSADFVSTDESLLTAPRQVNGNLPDNGFLRLASGSDLIDKGTNLGFPYNGTAPDLGAFEFKASQTLTFDSITAKKYNDKQVQLSGSASSGLSVSYYSSNPSVALVNGSILNITGVGTAVITASQPGNINYYAATEIKRVLLVNKNDQTITFQPLTAKTTGDAPFTLSASASSGLAATYASSNTSVATVSGNTVTVTGAGTTTITASQAGNSIYNAAPDVQQTLTVNSTATGITTFGTEGLKIYPNPTDGSPVELKFYLNSRSEVKIIILNYLGQTVYQTNAGRLGSGEVVQTLDLQSLAKGTYLIRIQTNDGIITRSLVRL